jgi:predicted nuclease with TOPRIM domain
MTPEICTATSEHRCQCHDELEALRAEHKKVREALASSHARADRLFVKCNELQDVVESQREALMNRPG